MGSIEKWEHWRDTFKYQIDMLTMKDDDGTIIRFVRTDLAPTHLLALPPNMTDGEAHRWMEKFCQRIQTLVESTLRKTVERYKG